MKARVKATGEIVEVEYLTGDKNGNKYYGVPTDTRIYRETELEMISDKDTYDYWTRLEHQYVGMAMQGILSNQEYVHSLVQRVASREILNLAEGITKHAEQLAHALVQKLKEKEEK